MAKTYYVSLGKKTGKNGHSIDECIQWLTDYQKELNQKARIFVDRLAEIGINVASANSGYYAGYIAFSKVDESNGDELSIVVNAHDISTIQSRWWHKGELVTNEISPILMAEFGAGWLADVKGYSISGVGRGTNSPYGHAFDDDWHWTTEDGVTHHAWERVAEMTPTHPMYKAIEQMRDSISGVAKEVFG